MKHPLLIETLTPRAEYAIPVYKNVSGGIDDSAPQIVRFLKLDIQQDGVLPETLIQLAKQYLESINTPPGSTRHISSAITKLDEALFWMNKPNMDRQKTIPILSIKDITDIKEKG